jgi:PAS domain S-box-containing protein
MDSAIILGHLTPILSTLSEGILLADANGQVTYVNPSFTQLTGFTDGDLLAKTCRAMQGPLTDKETVRSIRDAIHAARPFSGDILNYTKSGETFWNDLSITPVFEQGGLTVFLGITRDSSARKRATDLQDARERLYSFLFQHVQAGIVLHEADTRIVYTNEAALRLLGMTHEALVAPCPPTSISSFCARTDRRCRWTSFRWRAP